LRLGATQHEHGQLDDALASYRHSLVLDPKLGEAYSNMGLALQQKGDLAGAIECQRKAIALKPAFAGAYSNLGNALQEDGDLVGAVASYRQAQALQPDAVTHNNLGGALLSQGRLDEAIAEFTTALELQRLYVPAESNLLFALNYHPDKSPEEIFEAYRNFERRHAPPTPITPNYANDRRLDRRLKIGYVSPDFRHHPVRHFLEPLFDHHDKDVVEVYAYAEGATEDNVTARYQARADYWISILGMSDEALAQRIRADNIDVLVDLAGHTGNNRLTMFALKPAPVSLSWLGFGYTTGLSAIDYYLTDITSAPSGCEALFAETPWRLSTPCYAYRPGDMMGAVSPLPALHRGYLTFGTLTRAVRINHRTIRVWSEILRRVPRSRLIVDSGNFKQSPMQVDLAARFAAHGIGPGRLQIGFTSPPWDVLRGLDIGLDCFPHNSGTTLFETLYMGVPYVTLAGRPSVGRVGSSLLEGVGHSEWIAYSEEEYIEKAVALASDLPRLATLRSALRPEMQASPLMDEAGFARKVEAAYRQMFAAWLRGQDEGHREASSAVATRRGRM
jgi:predicted O-linked N-acetylglucosamine transferase (SPINDLY family)